MLNSVTGHVTKVTEERVMQIQGLKKVVNNFTMEVVYKSHKPTNNGIYPVAGKASLHILLSPLSLLLLADS